MCDILFTLVSHLVLSHASADVCILLICFTCTFILLLVPRRLCFECDLSVCLLGW